MSDQKKKNPALSEVALSKKIGIPPTTFNRLVNGYSQPNMTTLSKLIKNIPALRNCLPKTFKIILESAREELLPQGADFKNGEWAQQHKRIEETERMRETLLSDKYLFLCYVLVHSKKKVKEEEIHYHFGQNGLKATAVLVQKQWLSKIGASADSYYIVNQDHSQYVLSFELLKKHLIVLIKQYDPEDVDKSYIHCGVECLNLEGQGELIRAHREFHKKVMNIMGNKDYKGDKPVFSIACSDLLVKPMEEKQAMEDK